VQLTHIIILAIIQGFAEFLPISSSGHVVVVNALLKSDLEVADVNIFLHAGTLLSILVVYFHRILRLLGEDRRTIPLLIVGTLPVVVVGLVVKKFCQPILENVLLAGLMLIVTGVILRLASKFQSGELRYQELGYRRSVLIGLSQAFAILPGISRSGTTISSGLGCGLSRADAATFSFLLAIPAIGGATTLELFDIVNDAGLATPLSHLLIGSLISFVVGLFSLWWLLRWLQKGRLEYFSFWCIPLGLGIVAWQLWVVF
jgi:undecaprenyl-diphosphatase